MNLKAKTAYALLTDMRETVTEINKLGYHVAVAAGEGDACQVYEIAPDCLELIQHKEG